MKNKGVLSFYEQGLNFEVKGFKFAIGISSINILFVLFSFIIYIIMVLYLLNKNGLLELLMVSSLIVCFVLTMFTAINTIAIIFNYDALKLLIDEDDKVNRKKNSILNYWKILIIVTKVQNNLFELSIIWLMIGILLNYNLISIALIECIFLLWFFQISLFRNIPNYKADIFCDDEYISGAYIIEDFNSDSILLLKPRIGKNQQIRISKRTIKKMIFTVVPPDE